MTQKPILNGLNTTKNKPIFHSYIMPESYLTLEAFYDQIKTWKPDQSVSFSEKHVRYNRVTFTSRSQQESENVDSVDDWNNLDFCPVKSDKFSTVGNICNFISKFVTSHANSTVTIRKSLFTVQLKVEIKTNPMKWSDTKLNPYRNVSNIQGELEELVELLIPTVESDETSNYLAIRGEIGQIGKWVSKKCQDRSDVRDLIKIYVVDSYVFTSLNSLKRKFPLYSVSYDDKMFDNDSKYEFIKLCKATCGKMNLLFGNITEEDTKKNVETFLSLRGE